MHRVREAVRPLVPRRYHAIATQIAGAAVALALAGSRVECPCCGVRLRRFVRYPSLYCPRCSAYERHRLLALQLRERPDLLAPPLRLLQISPDRPLERVVEGAGIDRVSIDIENPSVDLRMDVHALTFPDDSFDVVLALAVLDVVDDQPRALAEIARVLRAGGRALLQVSPDQQPRLVENVRAAGLDVEALRASDLPAAAIERHGLRAGEETYVCRKR